MTSPVTYISSRGGDAVDFAEAVLCGAPENGGLFVPSTIPTIKIPEGDAVSSIAIKLFEPWVGYALSQNELGDICEQAFNFTIPMVELSFSVSVRVYVLELTHGPTGSFKDFGARWLARVIARLLAKRSSSRRVVVATSGDTGSAVADAFAGLDCVDVVLLFPRQGVSDIQRKQLTSTRAGVTVFEVDGVFDDCQALAKQALAMSSLRVPLTSANSINIGRLLPQMLYYAIANSKLSEAPVFVVPSGNLGNLTAGVMANTALQMEARFIAAHNANASMVRYLHGGKVNQPTISTISNAMDVGSPSNLERLQRLLGVEEARTLISASSFSDTQTISTMKHAFESANYVCDPHTAVGLAAVNESSHDGPFVVLSTAHPAKFPDVVESATGLKPAVPNTLSASLQGPESFRPCRRSGEEFFAFIQSKDIVTNTIR